MKKIHLLMLFFFCIATSFKQTNDAKLTMAVAANMQYAFDALRTDYIAYKGVAVNSIIGSSGKLTQQITEGAPFDIFISADTKYPQTLYQSKLTSDTPKIYANGVLVLWSTKDGIKPTADLKLLLADNIKAIAIANPKTAPYGVAAEEILKNYNLFDKVQPKIVYGESITQTSQYIATGAADIGFTAKAIVLSDEMKGKGSWVELDGTRYSPISQAAVITKYGQQNHQKDAEDFYNYLYSARAKKILVQFGYLVK